MSKIIAIDHGDECHQSSVEHLILPNDMVFAEELHRYNEWDQTGEDHFFSLYDCLIIWGARPPTEDELEIVFV